MLSLILAVVGTLLSLAGLAWILYQANTRQFKSLSLAVWVFRSGLLVFFIAEAWALFVHPEGNLTYKVLLIGSTLILALGLALLPLEYQQPGLVLEHSLSWQVILLSFGLYLAAVMFIQGLVMLVGLLLVWLAIRRARKWTANATEVDRRKLLNLALGTQIGVVVLTFILLFL
jgi:hypothetical protein